MVLSMISNASVLQNFKVGIDFLPFRKCPSASAMFTSVTARYHAKFLSCHILVSHVLSIAIVACILLLCSYTWWWWRKFNPNGFWYLNCLTRDWPSCPLYYCLVSAPSNSSSLIQVAIILMTYSGSLKQKILNALPSAEPYHGYKLFPIGEFGRSYPRMAPLCWRNQYHGEYNHSGCDTWCDWVA